LDGGREEGRRSPGAGNREGDSRPNWVPRLWVRGQKVCQEAGTGVVRTHRLWNSWEGVWAQR